MKWKHLGWAALALAAFSSSASAAIVQVIFTGTVGCNSDTGLTCSSTVDDLGVFSAPGTNLKGQAYTSTYVFDSNVSPFSDSTGIGVSGGPLAIPPNPTSPALSASITINGIVFAPGVSGFGELASLIAGSAIDFGAEAGAGNNSMLDQISTLNPIPSSITTPFTYSFQNGDLRFGEVVVTEGIISELLSLADATVTLSVLSPTSPTPLPAALPLFATGLGALGLLARRRRRKQVG